MKKSNKIWLIIAASLIVVGLIVYGAGIVLMDGDFSKLGTAKYETNTHTLHEEFQNIRVELDTADIRLLLAEDGVGRVECYEETNAKHSVTVEDGTLVIRLVNERKWYEYIGVNIDSPEITVYLPRSEYDALSVKGSTGSVTLPETICFESIDVAVSTGNVTCFSSASESLRIKASTGRIRIEDVQTESLALSTSTGLVSVSSVVCGNLDIRVSTGLTTVNNVSCKNLVSVGDTGDISLNNVIATGKFLIERNTGDVTFEDSDAAEVYVKTDTGDVTGSLLTDKVFIVKTDTGRVIVPNSVTGGRCEITTDTGDVKITIVG